MSFICQDASERAPLVITPTSLSYGYKVEGSLVSRNFKAANAFIPWQSVCVDMGPITLQGIEESLKPFLQQIGEKGISRLKLSGGSSLKFNRINPVILELWQKEKIGEVWYILKPAISFLAVNKTSPDTKVEVTPEEKSEEKVPDYETFASRIKDTLRKNELDAFEKKLGEEVFKAIPNEQAFYKLSIPEDYERSISSLPSIIKESLSKRLQEDGKIGFLQMSSCAIESNQIKELVPLITLFNPLYVIQLNANPLDEECFEDLVQLLEKDSVRIIDLSDTFLMKTLYDFLKKTNKISLFDKVYSDSNTEGLDEESLIQMNNLYDRYSGIIRYLDYRLSKE